MNLLDVAELTQDELASHMREGRLEVFVDGALSEWGSRVDQLFQKLEKGVMQWHETGHSRTIVLHFLEKPEEAPDVDTPSPVQEPAS